MRTALPGTSVVALTLALASVAGAYELKQGENGQVLYWADMPVAYFLVRDNVPGDSSGESAVHRAYATWTRASSNVRYEFAGFLREGENAFDEKNVTYWIHENWPYDDRAAALTFHYYETNSGRLLDADIVFNGERYTWSIGGTGFDIENSAAHEVGHFGGLGHSTRPEATMYSHTSAGETGKRTLADDDVAGLEALYGGTGGSTGGSSSGIAGDGGGGGGGGCSIARSPDGSRVAELAWIALLLGALRARARRRG